MPSDIADAIFCRFIYNEDNDEDNDEHFCRDTFVGFTFRSMLSFQI